MMKDHYLLLITHITPSPPPQKPALDISLLQYPFEQEIQIRDLKKVTVPNSNY